MQTHLKKYKDCCVNWINDLLIPSAPLSAAVWFGWALVIFIIPYHLYYNYTLNAFYHFGAPYADSGLFAHLLWHNDWSLANPHYRGDFSYFGVHITPVFLILSGLSYLIDTDMHAYFAAWTSALYALLGVIFFYCLRFLLYPKHHWHMLFMVFLALGVSFNAVVTHGIWMPHFEYAIPMTIFCFLFFYQLRKPLLWIPSFLFLLFLREDAGLHLVAVMGLLVALKYYEVRSFKPFRGELTLIVIAVIYSVFMLWLVGNIASTAGASQVMTFIYIGKPPFAHLTWDLFVRRLGVFTHEHFAAFIGMIITGLWAWRTRNPYLLIGFAANIPWVLLQLIARNDNTGNLYAYYSFPLLLGFIWPFLASLCRYGYPVPMTALKQSLWLQITLIIIGLFAWDMGLKLAAVNHARWGSYTLQSSTHNRSVLKAFIQDFNAGGGDYGRVIADFAVLSLVDGRYKGEYISNTEARPVGDTVIYINPYSTEPRHNNIRNIIVANQLYNKMCLSGTRLCLYTNRSIEQIRNSFPYFRPR